MTHEEARDILAKETDSSICITENSWLHRPGYMEYERKTFDVFILCKPVLGVSATTLTEALDKMLVELRAIKPPPDEKQFYADAERDCEVVPSTPYLKENIVLQRQFFLGSAWNAADKGVHGG